MKSLQLFALFGLPFAISCGDKGIEEDTNSTTEPSVEEPSTEDTGVEEVVPLVPVAIGFEYSGIWDEANSQLLPYLFPDLNNTNEGVPLGLGNLVTITLASGEYFGLGSEATDEERAYETCTFYADFAYSPADLLADDFDWTEGVGGTGDYSVEAWQSFEGTLVIRPDSASERCAELDAEYSVEMFDNMRFGLVMGPLSKYMTTELESTDWWADDLEAQASYFTQYIAVNHPADTTLGYDFIGYDWTSSIFVEADPETCFDVSTNTQVDVGTEGDTVVCGLVQTEETADGASFVFGDAYSNVGARYGYVQGNAWWYEDFPNLDVTLLASYPE